MAVKARIKRHNLLTALFSKWPLVRQIREHVDDKTRAML